jgi:hypothetical protein
VLAHEFYVFGQWNFDTDSWGNFADRKLYARHCICLLFPTSCSWSNKFIHCPILINWLYLSAEGLPQLQMC